MWDILRENWVFILIGQYPNGPIGGLALTIILAAMGLVLSFGLGIVLAVALASPSALARRSAAFIVAFFRGMPLLLLMFWAYFLVPAIIGYAVSAFVTMLAALILYQSAYMAEVVRSGINGLSKGQHEAATALGFGFFRRMTYFILPQALRAIVPSLITQFVSIIKDTSLGYVIGVAELTYVGNQINTNILSQPFQVFGLLAIIYFILCFGIATFARIFERRFTVDKGRATWDSYGEAM